MNSESKPCSARHTILVTTSFACYWLWTFAVLIAKLIPQQETTSVFEDSWFWSTLGHLSALLIVIALARFYAPFSNRRVIVASSPFVCLFGYALLLYSNYIYDGSLPCLLLGSVLTGVGNSGLLVCWCESFTSGYQGEGSRIVVAAGILLSIVVFILFTVIPQPVLQVILALLPFMTTATTSLSLREASNTHVTPSENQTYSPYFALFCLVYALPLGFFQMHFGTETGHLQGWLQILIPSFVFIALFMTIDALLFKKFQITILAKTIVPIGIAGLLFLSLFNSGGMLLGGVLIYSSQQFIAIFFYCLFASMSALGRSHPSKTFATGVVFIDVGYVAGQLIAEVSRNLFGGIALEFSLGVVYIAAIVGVFLFPRVTEALSIRRNSSGQNNLSGQKGQGLPLQPNSSATRSQFNLNNIIKEHQLTAREGDMLHYLMRGKSVAGIASETFLSQNTVKTHISHIYQKLDVHSRDELINYIESILEK